MHHSSHLQIGHRLWSNSVRQRLKDTVAVTGSNSVQRFEAVLWSNDSHVCLSTTGRVRRTSPLTTTTAAALAVKVKATSSHIAMNVFDDHWTTHYGCFSDNTKPLAVKVNQFRRHDTRQSATARNHAAVACGATGSRSITHAGGQQLRVRHQTSWLLCHWT